MQETARKAAATRLRNTRAPGCTRDRRRGQYAEGGSPRGVPSSDMSQSERCCVSVPFLRVAARLEGTRQLAALSVSVYAIKIAPYDPLENRPRKSSAFGLRKSSSFAQENRASETQSLE